MADKSVSLPFPDQRLKPIQPNLGVEAAYRKSLKKLLREMRADVQGLLERHYTLTQAKNRARAMLPPTANGSTWAKACIWTANGYSPERKSTAAVRAAP